MAPIWKKNIRLSLGLWRESGRRWQPSQSRLSGGGVKKKEAGSEDDGRALARLPLPFFLSFRSLLL